MSVDPLHDVVPSEELLNLGPKSARWLEQVGIRTLGDLKQTGAVAAYLMAKRKAPQCSLNLLYALEGALTGLPWNKLSEKTKQRLRTAVQNE
ncbi:TfoX/Sxy family protein [Gimesia aquarii]|uniref:TfoX C-terminal domain-containing protein n=1 Tax=Gimesia aquarii TaxID=2527964 RepID=A0A517WSZ1_9PLAN|nr:TfoX/Sxy family protein [Gimesia aquarii]QDU08379.1 hypothetical protein V202x_17470 [Gimesia aquarii]